MFFLNINNKFILGIFLLINSLFAETKHSYIVLDANTKEILKEENSTTKQGIASLTKIWTALIVLENSKLDDEVIISKNASFQKGSSIYLKENQVYTIRDLVYGMLLRSGNDAAVALAEHISGSEKEFTKLMNKKLKDLGIYDTNFVDVTGLGNNISTAKDVATMFQIALKNYRFKGISSQILYKHSFDGQAWKNKHKLIGYKDKYSAFSGKTGYTKNTGRTLATAFYNNDKSKSIIIVTLNEQNDWNIHKTLAQQVFNKMN